jgi:hypothetical protein
LGKFGKFNISDFSISRIEFSILQEKFEDAKGEMGSSNCKGVTIRCLKRKRIEQHSTTKRLNIDQHQYHNKKKPRGELMCSS